MWKKEKRSCRTPSPSLGPEKKNNNNRVPIIIKGNIFHEKTKKTFYKKTLKSKKKRTCRTPSPSPGPEDVKRKMWIFFKDLKPQDMIKKSQDQKMWKEGKTFMPDPFTESRTWKKKNNRVPIIIKEKIFHEKTKKHSIKKR